MRLNQDNDVAAASGKIRSLAELPCAIEPPRDLWPAIAAGIGGANRPAGAPTGWPWALAAGLAAVVVGVLLGRASLTPLSNPLSGSQRPLSDDNLSIDSGSATIGAVAGGAILDAAYAAERKQLRSQVLRQIAALAPTEREQLARSVTALQTAVDDIQSALGKDPGNALLQELLVNACQDEMTHLSDINSSESRL